MRPRERERESPCSSLPHVPHGVGTARMRRDLHHLRAENHPK
jgi:hypothetical protein